MKRHLNTLFVMTQGAYVHKDNDNVVVSVERQERMRLPIHTLGSIVCFGNIMCSPYLLGHCAENRVSVAFLTERGRFLARVEGSTKGNVLLRRRQYRMADQETMVGDIARQIVAGKIANTAAQVKRFQRERHPEGHVEAERTVKTFRTVLKKIENVSDPDMLRGYEGEAAKAYFSILDDMILRNKDSFHFTVRSRRPPLDRVNALLSFMYTIVLHDVQSGLETVGLDPAVGFLHRDRPGRPGLALDLMEEFRPWLADRVVLGLINHDQIKPNDFDEDESGAVLLNEDGRKILLTAYQNRKQEEVRHPYLDERVTIGTLFFIQPLLFARYVRGELDAYPVYIPR
jgi:CRISPR-associated protein Cas1